MITKHPWFGPKQSFGWGWKPVSWEGWAVTAAWLLAVAAAWFFLGPTTFAFQVAAVALVIVLIAVCWLTGLPPG